MAGNPDLFTARTLSHTLRRLTHQSAPSFCVAYSGGLDSHVLLHAMVQYLADQLHPPPLRIVHINHGVSEQASAFETHVRAICDDLQVSLVVRHVQVVIQAGDSPEEEMRKARYWAFQELLEQHEHLLMAHTQDDQAETFLLQLCRGAGVKGLGSMPEKKSLGQGKLLRPLLHISREALRRYAESEQLLWIEDESNHDLAFARNYIRHQMIPVWRLRWPQVSRLIARSAEHCAATQSLLNVLAEQDMEGMLREKGLCIASLLQLPLLRLRNVLRFWIAQHHGVLPSQQHLEQIYQDVLLARPDANPVFAWPGAELRRYQNILYLLQPKQTEMDVCRLATVLPWDFETPLPVGGGLQLEADRRLGIGLSTALLVNEVSVRFRRGGERCRLPGRRQTHSLKALMQIWKIPPWERAHIPLIYYQDQLVMVVGHVICDDFAALPDEMGWDVRCTWHVRHAI